MPQLSQQLTRAAGLEADRLERVVVVVDTFLPVAMVMAERAAPLTATTFCCHYWAVLVVVGQ